MVYDGSSAKSAGGKSAQISLGGWSAPTPDTHRNNITRKQSFICMHIKIALKMKELCSGFAVKLF